MMPLDNPWPLALKASGAAMLAYGLCLTFDLPDTLSALFIAVVCVSPTVLAGLRRAIGQGLGSIIGGALAAALMILGVPTVLSLGLSIGGAVIGVFKLGFWRAHVVAAFTAIYVHMLPLGGPGETFGIRLMAVGVGAVAAMVTNTIVSAMFYDSIFARRLLRVAERVAEGAEGIERGDLVAMVPAFEMLSGLSSELSQAKRELDWRGDTDTARRLRLRRQRVRALIRVAHFAHDLGLTVDEAGEQLADVDRRLLKHVSQTLRDAASDAPTGAGEVGTRLLAALSRYEAAS